MNHEKEGCFEELVQGEIKRWKSWSSSGGYSVVIGRRAQIKAYSTRYANRCGQD